MKELLQILLDRLKQVPDIKSVALFNNQMNKAIDNDYVFFPLILLEINDVVEYESGLGDYQYGTCTVRVHIINDSPLQGSEWDIYELKDTVHKYLHKYSTGYFNPLVRTSERLDTKHTNTYNYQIDYTTRFTELTELSEEYDSTTVKEIEVQYDLYDDGDEIKIDIIK